MLGSNIDELDKLLSPDLVFTNHLGQIMSKEDDLAAHSSGAVKISELELSEQRVQTVINSAVVTVKVHIAGSFGGTQASADFRFTRVWSRNDAGSWQVITAHSCVVV